MNTWRSVSSEHLEVSVCLCSIYRAHVCVCVCVCVCVRACVCECVWSILRRSSDTLMTVIDCLWPRGTIL